MALLLKIVTLLIFVSLARANWRNWANGNGVHDRPVFLAEPQVLWTFSHETGPADEGVIVVRSSDNNIFFTNGNDNAPLFWMFAPNGTELFSWDDPNLDGYCDGSLTENNGIVYIFNDGLCKMYAVDLSDGSIVWQLNQTDLCLQFPNPSASAFLWEGDTHFYFSSWSTTHKIEAATGSIVWSRPSTNPGVENYFLHPIRASDHNIVLHDASNVLYKLNKDDGTVMWTKALGGVGDNAPPAPTVHGGNGRVLVPDVNGNVLNTDFEGNQNWVASIPSATFRPGSLVHFVYGFLFLGDASSGDILRISNDGEFVVAWDNSLSELTAQKSIQSQMVWSNNVLYAVYNNGRLCAFNTTDSAALELLWSMALPINSNWGAGPSIDTDGNIYLSSDAYSSTEPSLVAIGCPLGDCFTPRPPVTAPVSAPVDAPLDAPVNGPVSSSPVSSPVKAPTSSTSSATLLASSVAVIATSLIAAM